MARKASDEKCCVLTLALHTEPWQEHIIEKRFAIMEHLKNQLIAMELRKLKNAERTKAYRNLLSEIEHTPSEERKKLYKERQNILKNAGFSEYDFKDDMAGKNSEMQKHFSEHIAVQIAHKAASDVWRAFEKYLYSNGKAVHFHKRGTLDSIACQKPGNGMDFKDGVFRWSGGKSKEHPNQIILNIRAETPETDYEREMLQKPVKNMRIVRKWIKTRYRYYLQLTLAGEPPRKPRQYGEGRVGIDIGPQTAAIVSENSVRLLELADKVNRNHRKKLQLQQKMDRSRRRTNPDNFNPDGTIRKPPPGKRLRWNRSKRYEKLAGAVRELERKNADIRKYQHTCLANEVLTLGDRIYVEKMSFSGLQHRAKETTKDEKGRFRKKKRFGKSLANKAPASFLSILKGKALRAGMAFTEVNTASFRASQFDHTDGSYKKSLLSERIKHLSDGTQVQRDLYSAFLLMNSDASASQCDSALCKETFPHFLSLHNAEIKRIQSDPEKHPSSFGF